MKYYLGQLEYRERISSKTLQVVMPGVFGWRMPVGAIAAIDLRTMDEMVNPLATPTSRVLFACPDHVSLPSPHRQIATNLRETLVARDRDDLRRIFGSPATGSTSLCGLLWELLTRHCDCSGLVRPKALMPWFDGKARLKMAGDCPMVQRVSPGMPEWNAVAETFGRTYREIYTQELQRLCPMGLGAQMLGAIERGFRLTREQTRAIVPQDLPRREPGLPGTVFSESFPGTSDTLGGDLTWTEVNGTWDNSSGVGRHTSAGGTDFARAEHDVSTADHEVSCTQNTTSGGVYAGPMARFSAAANTGYACVAELTINDYYGTRYVAGVSTDIITSELSGSIGAGTVDKVRCQGSTIEIFQDVNTRGDTTDMTIAGGTRGGIACFSATGQWPDWSISDLGGGGSIAGILAYQRLRGQ